MNCGIEVSYMVSRLLKDKNTYFCSNCRMRQFDLRPNCVFCGNHFSNYEEIVIKEEKENFNNKVRDRDEKDT